MQIKENTNLKRKLIKRMPSWLKSKIPSGENYKIISKELRKRSLFTVCEEASCPNMAECWDKKTATMMILGDICTRGCRFCKVKTGHPGGIVNEGEIQAAVEMVKVMSLKYLVVTSVDRDDLADYGATHFANVVKAIKSDYPNVLVEVLVPDFCGDENSMNILGKSSPFVIAHNVETVRRLSTEVRDQRAGYQKSLDVLKFYKTNFHNIATKSSIMIGLGESMVEIEETLRDLKNVGVNIVTLGQYLTPTKKHLAVEKYYTPEEFTTLKKLAYRIGFDFVASGPMVRSSYRAYDYLEFLKER